MNQSYCLFERMKGSSCSYLSFSTTAADTSRGSGSVPDSVCSFHPPSFHSQRSSTTWRFMSSSSAYPPNTKRRSFARKATCPDLGGSILPVGCNEIHSAFGGFMERLNAGKTKSANAGRSGLNMGFTAAFLSATTTTNVLLTKAAKCSRVVVVHRHIRWFCRAPITARCQGATIMKTLNRRFS